MKIVFSVILILLVEVFTNTTKSNELNKNPLVYKVKDFIEDDSLKKISSNLQHEEYKTNKNEVTGVDDSKSEINEDGWYEDTRFLIFKIAGLVTFFIVFYRILKG